ncbi:MAG: hypothetical protein WAS72_06065 [Saprospiraceae bacterium]
MTDLNTSHEVTHVVGNVYTHRLSGDKLRIKKIYGGVVTCESEIVMVIFEKPDITTNIVICAVENLKNAKV